jgi:hypothetical protein
MLMQLDVGLKDIRNSGRGWNLERQSIVRDVGYHNACAND